MRRRSRAPDPAPGDGHSSPVHQGRHRRQELASFWIRLRTRGRIGTVRGAERWDAPGRHIPRVKNRNSTLTLRLTDVVAPTGGSVRRGIRARRMVAVNAERWRDRGPQGGVESGVSCNARGEAEHHHGNHRHEEEIVDPWPRQCSVRHKDHLPDIASRRRGSPGQRSLVCRKHAPARRPRHRSP